MTAKKTTKANLITFENAAEELRSINAEADEIASTINSIEERIYRRKSAKGSKP